MTEEHLFMWEHQPIADQVMAHCSCGWRKAVSLYEYTPEGAVERARQIYRAHIIEEQSNA